MFNKRSAFLLTLGLGVRLWLINNVFISSWLRNRLEISTPLTSWNRVLEGLYLRNKIGTSLTYDGDLVHELPLMLHIYQLLINIFGQFLLSYLFILLDILNAIVLHLVVQECISNFYMLEMANIKAGKYKRLFECNRDDSGKATLNQFLLNKTSFNSAYWSFIALSVYLFNPFTVASCAAQSTVVVHNLILLLWFYFLLREQVVLAFLCLGLHANITVYSASLVIGSIVFLYQKKSYLNDSAHSTSFVQFSTRYLTLFMALTIGIFGLNLYLEEFNTRFIACTYLFILQVPDLSPNMGLFWYFFTEMFDHFRLFFTYVFQFNVVIYTLPIALRLRDEPIVGILIQIGLTSILKSYPSIGETGLFLSLLPMVAYLFPLLRNFLIYSCMLIASFVLGPVMSYLWLGGGVGNANFYFAITLVYSVGQIFLIIDIFYAQVKREFIKTHGANIPKNADASNAQFQLE